MYCHERGPFSTFSLFEYPSRIPRTGFHISPQRYFKSRVQFWRCPGRHAVETLSALKQCTCAQNVSDVIQSLRFVMLVHTCMRGQVLSSIVSAHRSGRTLELVFTLRDAGHTLIKPSGNAPAHKICQMLFTAVALRGASLNPAAGPSALKYRACAQSASDLRRCPHILGHWLTAPAHRVCTAPAHRTCQMLSISSYFEVPALIEIRGSVLMSTVPANRLCQMLQMFPHVWALSTRPDEGNTPEQGMRR